MRTVAIRVSGTVIRIAHEYDLDACEQYGTVSVRVSMVVTQFRLHVQSFAMDVRTVYRQQEWCHASREKYANEYDIMNGHFI